MLNCLSLIIKIDKTYWYIYQYIDKIFICCFYAPQDASSIINMQISSKRVSLSYLKLLVSYTESPDSKWYIVYLMWYIHKLKSPAKIIKCKESWMFGFKPNLTLIQALFSFKTSPSLLCHFTATAVCGVWHRHCAGTPSSLQCVWEGLCWVLPGQRPVLRVGWNILYSLPAKHQEVNDMHQMTIHSFWPRNKNKITVTIITTVQLKKS